jgi:hypothetical protein
VTHPIETPFMLGDRVWLDGDESIVATITCMLFNGCWSFQISWMSNGDYKDVTVGAWRLTIVPGEEPEPDYPKLGEK